MTGSKLIKGFNGSWKHGRASQVWQVVAEGVLFETRFGPRRGREVKGYVAKVGEQWFSETVTGVLSQGFKTRKAAVNSLLN